MNPDIFFDPELLMTVINKFRETYSNIDCLIQTFNSFGNSNISHLITVNDSINKTPIFYAYLSQEADFAIFTYLLQLNNIKYILVPAEFL